MIRMYTLSAAVAVATVASLTGSAYAASLAGNEGDVQRRPFFSLGATGGCQKSWKMYLAASGHSAYATTLDHRSVEGFICAGWINAGSKRDAESKALARCYTALKYYKAKVMRKCEIAASK